MNHRFENEVGLCCRCGGKAEGVHVVEDMYLCAECFQEWKRWAGDMSEEGVIYCDTCGKTMRSGVYLITTMRLCEACFRSFCEMLGRVYAEANCDK